MAGNANSGGRNAKAPAEHRARGTFQPSRHAGFDNPDPPAGRPIAPKALTGVAREEWDRMVERLETSKTLSTVDDAALYQYAQLFAETETVRTDTAETRRLSATLKREAKKLDGADLVAAVSEIVKLQFLIAKETQQLRQGHMAIRQYLIEFGMTPSARTRVKIPAGAEAKTPSLLDRYLRVIPGGQAKTS